MPKRKSPETIAKTPHKTATTKSLSAELLSRAQLIASIAIERKALDVLLLDVSTVTDFTNVFVIASGTSDRHVKGIADRVIDTLTKDHRIKPLNVSGLEKGEWVLVDYADIVVHIFHEPVRQFYALEDLWAKGKVIELDESLSGQAKLLRTGLLAKKSKPVPR